MRSGFRGREHNESAFEPLCEWEEHWQTGATELSGPDQLRPDTFIREINGRRGITVLLTTHDLGDVEELCKRLIIINRGHIVEDGPLAE